MAAIRKVIEFIVVLDLVKAYDNVLKILMSNKLLDNTDENLTNQLTIFLLMVQEQVTGDISNTTIAMRRGLTQGGTSYPALFRVFINDLPDEIRTVLREIAELTMGTDPVRLVADDIIGMAQTGEGLRALLEACEKWAHINSLQWNPEKSQVLRIHPQSRHRSWRSK